jgi:hypothetical protein
MGGRKAREAMRGLWEKSKKVKSKLKSERPKLKSNLELSWDDLGQNKRYIKKKSILAEIRPKMKITPVRVLTRRC